MGVGSLCAHPPPLPSALRWVPTSLPTCPQALRVNGLEQLCNNLASERLQLFSSQMLLAQEEVRGTQNRGHLCYRAGTALRALPQHLLAMGCLSPSEPQFSHL